MWNQTEIIMKLHSLSISIPEPCHEDWAEMTPIKNIYSANRINSNELAQNSMNFSTLKIDRNEANQEKGRHCASCNKTVIDFTKMSKTGIASYNSSHEGGMCGRFSLDQLDVNLLPASRNRLFSKWAAVLLGLIPFAGYGQAPVHTNELIEHTIMGKRMINSVKTQISKPISEKGNLKGKLIDAETKEPIIFGTIALMKEGVLISGVETDLDGNFNIDIYDVDEIVFSYIGYEHIKKSTADIKKNYSTPLTIELEMQGYLLGDVVIVDHKFRSGCILVGSYVTVTTEHESWLKRQWRKFKKLVKTSHNSAVENRKNARDNEIEEISEFQELETREISSKAVGVIPYEDKVINIYPNPSAGLVTIQMPEGFSQGILQILNTENQILFSSNIYGDEYQYDASDLLSGSYIISIISEKELVASEVFIKI